MPPIHKRYPYMHQAIGWRAPAVAARLMVLLMLLLTGAAAPEHPMGDTIPQSALYIVNADGTGLKQLMADPYAALWGPA